MKSGMMIFLRQSTKDTKTEKRSLVSENPPATASGVNSPFAEKMIMDLRNETSCEVIMG